MNLRLSFFALFVYCICFYRKNIYPLAAINVLVAGDIMDFTHVEGKDKGKVTLYALSTCIWCKKTKELLSELGVGYDYIYVDLVDKADRPKVLDEVMKYNPDRSFPTLVIGDKGIVGFREKEIREALGK
jgi:glutaredoxin